MAIPLASETAVCSTCGEPLNAKGECVACLLRRGLDESVAEAKSDVTIAFGDFEIALREDGSLWELGRGAMGVTYLAVDNVLRRKLCVSAFCAKPAPLVRCGIRTWLLSSSLVLHLLRKNCRFARGKVG